MLDLDATDIPLYGHQPERFFHGYYDSYCYLPLYIFAGDQLLCARLRPANQDAAKGSVEEVSRIVTQLRERWPEVQHRAESRLRLLPRRADGLVRDRIMSTMCSAWRGTSGWQRSSAPRCIRLRSLHQSSGKAARVFAEFSYQTRKSWSLRTPRGGQGRASR